MVGISLEMLQVVQWIVRAKLLNVFNPSVNIPSARGGMTLISGTLYGSTEGRSSAAPFAFHAHHSYVDIKQSS